MRSSPPGRHIATALDRYVAAPDPSYSCRAASTIRGSGYSAHLLELTSQRWRNAAEVDRPLWTHWLTIVVPGEVASDAALLAIAGGSNASPAPTQINPLLSIAAVMTRSVVAELRMVPNQPLTFVEESEPRAEDGIIAYSWDKYLRTGEEAWPLRLPMTKSVVRAMDAITHFCRDEKEVGIEIGRFVLAGASKRGWTAWTTAAVDRRVVAVVPLVIDLLNIESSFEHHYRAYGFWAPAIAAYQASGIMRWAGTPELAALLGIEDPFAYRDRLTLPKFMINSAGDQFFLPELVAFLFRCAARGEIPSLHRQHRPLLAGLRCAGKRARLLPGDRRRGASAQIFLELRAGWIDCGRGRDPAHRSSFVARDKSECARFPAGSDRPRLPPLGGGTGRSRPIHSQNARAIARMDRLFHRADLPEPRTSSVQVHDRRPGYARHSAVRPSP